MEIYYSCCKTTLVLDKVNRAGGSRSGNNHMLREHGQFHEIACLVCINKFKFITYSGPIECVQKHLKRTHEDSLNKSFESKYSDELKIENPIINYDLPDIVGKKQYFSDIFAKMNKSVNFNQEFENEFNRIKQMDFIFPDKSVFLPSKSKYLIEVKPEYRYCIYLANIINDPKNYSHGRYHYENG